MTDAEWRKLLRKQLGELVRYCEANVESDQMHQLMIKGALASAANALRQKLFWPGYIEALTRLVLILLGDYPDHRRRRGKGMKANHYSLQRQRSLIYSQSAVQKVWLLIWAQQIGVRQFSVTVGTALGEYYVAEKSRATKQGFLNWFRDQFPSEYASVF